MFSELNTPVEVAIALDLPADQVQAIQGEYWTLAGMSSLAQIYDEAKYDLHDLLALHRIAKDRGDSIAAVMASQKKQLHFIYMPRIILVTN